jgi:hypothetical protein
MLWRVLLLWFRAQRYSLMHPLPPPVVCSVFHSLDKLICDNWDLVNLPVDVMAVLFLVDLGMVLLCFLYHPSFA